LGRKQEKERNLKKGRKKEDKGKLEVERAKK
jgi:hypothetical protein